MIKWFKSLFPPHRVKTATGETRDLVKHLYSDDGPASGEDEILTTGVSDCNHLFTLQEWDRNSLGPGVTNFSTYHATFKEHIKCSKCGREVIKSVRNLY